MILLAVLSGMVGMIQLDDPCATPDAPLLEVQLTCTLPDPPETVPVIDIDDAVVEPGGAVTASSNGLAGAGAGVGAGAGAGAGLGLGLGLGLDAVLGAAYNSWTAAMSFGISTVCIR